MNPRGFESVNLRGFESVNLHGFESVNPRRFESVNPRGFGVDECVLWCLFEREEGLKRRSVRVMC